MGSAALAWHCWWNACGPPPLNRRKGLLGAVLSIEQGSARLHQVPGTVPAPRDFVNGDRFAPRSAHPDIGVDTRPVLLQVPDTSHYYAGQPDLEELQEASR